MASLVQPLVGKCAASTAHRSARFYTLGAIAFIIAMQVWLVFAKSINWDEFLHFSQIYELRQGRLVHSIQVLHTRMFYWLPLIGGNLIDQLRIGRIGMLGFELITAAALFGIARKFASDLAALLACLAYLGGGYVFLYGFSFRPDPMATAMLMSALYLLATRKLSVPTGFLIAALTALSGMATIKSGFYLPCFAGIAWLRWCETEDRKTTIISFGTICLAAPILFAIGYFLHTRGLAIGAPSLEHQPIRDVWPRFFAEGLFPKFHYLQRQALLAPFLTLAIVFAPFAWRASGLDKNHKLALLGLLLPLASVAIYRNSFPYYYVFVLAPVAVTIAPLFELITRRYDYRLVLALLAMTPIPAMMLEHRDVIGRQRAVIDEVHRLFPEPTPYLSYSGIVGDYPRIIPFLTSGIGLANYNQGGDAIISREIHEGRLPVIVADRSNIVQALNGVLPENFLPQDVAAMHANYAHYWGPIWLEGHPVRPGRSYLEIERSGAFTLSGGAMTIDGKPLDSGQTIELAPGRYATTAAGGSGLVLWRGRTPPPSPPPPLDGELYTKF